MTVAAAQCAGFDWPLKAAGGQHAQTGVFCQQKAVYGSRWQVHMQCALFTQPPMRRMRRPICFTDVFSVSDKIPDNRSREQLNGFS